MAKKKKAKKKSKKPVPMTFYFHGTETIGEIDLEGEGGRPTRAEGPGESSTEGFGMTLGNLTADRVLFTVGRDLQRARVQVVGAAGREAVHELDRLGRELLRRGGGGKDERAQ